MPANPHDAFGRTMMSMMKWDPWRDMEEMFDRYSKSLGWPKSGSQELVAGSDWTPRVDISETDKEFHIKAEIPDVKKEDVKVSVENGVLTVRGEKKRESEEKGKKYHRIERQYGSFVRSFTLPDTVDESKIKASFAEGILNLTLQKTEHHKPKSIEVKID
jgi:HSP20 family protein